jgi:uncharacterized membrane protein YkoI
MKKKIGMITAIFIGAAVLGLGIYQSDAVHGEPDLSQEEVREIVSSQYPGEITEITLESDVQTAVYEVILEHDGKRYILKIDGYTGEVLEMEEEDLPEQEASEGSGDQSTDTDSSADNNTEEQGQEEETEKNDEQTEKKEESNEEDSKEEGSKERSTIDSEEARRIALNEFDGTVTDLELDEDDGRLIYEIEIERGDEEAEIEIDAYTGEVIVISIDTDD